MIDPDKTNRSAFCYKCGGTMHKETVKYRVQKISLHGMKGTVDPARQPFVANVQTTSEIVFHETCYAQIAGDEYLFGDDDNAPQAHED